MNENQLSPNAQKLFQIYRQIVAAAPETQQEMLRIMNEQIEMMESDEAKDFAVGWRDIIAEGIEEARNE